LMITDVAFYKYLIRQTIIMYIDVSTKRLALHST